MSSDEIAIRVSGLSKCYRIYEQPQDRLKQAIYPRLREALGLRYRCYHKEFWALKDVSFEVRKGESVGIIGRNGSGKSTLLQIVCGTLNPTSGTIETNGRVAALLELGSGFHPEFTGRENVYMNGAILGLSRAEIDARYDDIVGFADIGQFTEQPLRTYSSGMVMRLAFAVMAHVDADILVIDEALAVGDAFFVQKCMRFLRAFLERGTLIFVSHDTGAVVNLTRRAVWLEAGRVAGIGAPKEITAEYLQKVYEDQQGPSAEVDALVEPRTDVELPQLDMRQALLNKTPYRNDIQLFAFSADAPSFGRGGISVVNVSLRDADGASLSWVVGAERVRLQIDCHTNRPVFSPIVGFAVKDRLGQVLFADNTFLSYVHQPLDLEQGDRFNAQFDFMMPVMPLGDYSISVAVAEGTQAEHVQHQWFHEAMTFKVHSTSVGSGLIGIPMMRIALCKS